VTRDGRDVGCKCYNPILDAEGKRRVVAYLSDITTTPGSDHERTFRGALNQSPVTMVADGQADHFVNPAAAQTLARGRGRLPPRPAGLQRQRNAGAFRGMTREPAAAQRDRT
jgi:hypothetical protein